MKYIKLFDGIDTFELTPRPVVINGWGDPISSTEKETIDGNVKDYIPAFKIRRMEMIYENLTEEYRDQVLKNISEFKDYDMLVIGLKELFEDTDNQKIVPIHIKGISVNHRRVTNGYLYDIIISFRDRI